MVQEIAFYILGCLYASLEGYTQAFLFHYKNTSSDQRRFELHPVFNVSRFLILGLLFPHWFLMLALLFSFSFFHNGFYYLQRNNLDKHLYPHRFTDYSTTSTAKFEFSFEQRTWLFVTGILILTASFILPLLTKT